MKNWRKMTWVLIAWSALTVVWAVVGGVSSAHEAHKYCEQTRWQETCEQAHNAGTAIGVGMVLGVGFAGFIVLSLVWFMTRPKAAA
jgi:hypothetical protein